MEILETKGRKMNKIKREERENLHTFSDTTEKRAKKRINATIVTTIHEKSYTNTGIIGITVNPIMAHISQIAIFVL